jgi:hypothetical protein
VSTLASQWKLLPFGDQTSPKSQQTYTYIKACLNELFTFMDFLRHAAGYDSAMRGNSASSSVSTEALSPARANLLDYLQQEPICWIISRKSQYAGLSPERASLQDYLQQEPVCRIISRKSQSAGLSPARGSLLDFTKLDL